MTAVIVQSVIVLFSVLVGYGMGIHKNDKETTLD